MKKILSILMSLLMAAGISVAAVGCGGTPAAEEVAGKTNITVATYNGGVGKEWLDDAARAFEEKFAAAVSKKVKRGLPFAWNIARLPI